jgi:hypothetical protein
LRDPTPTLPRKRGARGHPPHTILRKNHPCGTFPDECCFQVIYFVSDISFVARSESAAKPRIETCWLTHAVKNAWAAGDETAV